MLLSIWCVGMLGRGYWTPDEPREADISWRMSWQADKAVPLLAGEPFCEKPPLTYWLAAMPIELLGVSAWAARLPNVLYAMITALAVGLLARRAAGSLAAFAAAAAIGSFLLSYQVAIWLATDAPLLAAVSLALLGLYHGFYAAGSRDRLRGYLLMHAALGVGFLAKSAAAWMVPALALTTLIVWERRWRELLRWELYVGLALQAAIVLLWVCFVYAGPDGSAHLKVFFWNNLVGRFTSVDAPTELQYATGHRNSPGKYLLELPIYLWPWTLLCLAAVRRAWQRRRGPADQLRAVRFAVATFLPSLLILSVAATARDIYLAPALPGAALLLGWWSVEILRGHDCWDVRALRATTLLLLLAAVVEAAVVTLLGVAAGPSLEAPASYALIAALGIGVAVYLILYAWFALGRRRFLAAELALFVGYCSLLVGPASQAYHEADRWQDLAALGAALRGSRQRFPSAVGARRDDPCLGRYVHSNRGDSHTGTERRCRNRAAQGDHGGDAACLGAHTIGGQASDSGHARAGETIRNYAEADSRGTRPRVARGLRFRGREALCAAEWSSLRLAWTGDGACRARTGDPLKQG